MRYFNTVLFTVALVFAISFGWSLSSATSWWVLIQYILHGSAVGWVIVTLTCLAILRLGVRRWRIRGWVRILAMIMPLAWLGLTLALRGEWSIVVMIAVSTAIMAIFATPAGSPKNNSGKKAPGAWKEKVRRLFVEPDHGADPGATTPHYLKGQA